MSNAEAIADWMENMPHGGIYDEAQSFRRILLDSFKPDRVTWEGLTPEKISVAVAAWLAAKKPGKPTEPLEEAPLVEAGVKIREWLTQHEERTKAPALLSVDEFQGTLHALHCSLRGLDMWAEHKAAQAKSAKGGFNSNFNLRG